MPTKSGVYGMAAAQQGLVDALEDVSARGGAGQQGGAVGGVGPRVVELLLLVAWRRGGREDTRSEEESGGERRRAEERGGEEEMTIAGEHEKT